MSVVPPAGPATGPVCLADYAALAQARLDPAVHAYFSGGAGDEHTLRANALAWQALALRPRVLADLRGAHCRVELLGRTLAHPLIVAPMAAQGLAHPQGEAAMALAAAMQGAGFVLSQQAGLPLAEVAARVREEPGRGPLWFQLSIHPDRAQTRALARAAEAAGYEALVLTVDAPVHGVRDRERRAGFTLPAAQARANLPRALVPAGVQGVFAPPGAPPPTGLAFHAGRWEDVADLKSASGLPLLLKGVTHPEDARQALDTGVDGLIVSNHGGRTLDTVLPTAHLLPAIVQAVAGRIPVLVDGGITRGTDVFKAMGLGASAVLVGRPMLWALAVAGPQGVAHALRLLRDELEATMALAGCPLLAQASQFIEPPAGPGATIW